MVPALMTQGKMFMLTVYSGAVYSAFQSYMHMLSQQLLMNQQGMLRVGHKLPLAVLP